MGFSHRIAKAGRKSSLKTNIGRIPIRHSISSKFYHEKSISYLKGWLAFSLHRFMSTKLLPAAQGAPAPQLERIDALYAGRRNGPSHKPKRNGGSK
ncbi:MAG TPA: hypothetical protein ENN79_03860 [Desulfobacteraceae bacterium]|nr:hypothetical protein [Desulfobacteraceae bacterium]